MNWAGSTSAAGALQPASSPGRPQDPAWPHPDHFPAPFTPPRPAPTPPRADFSAAGNNEWGVGGDRPIASQHRDRLPQFTEPVEPVSSAATLPPAPDSGSGSGLDPGQACAHLPV